MKRKILFLIFALVFGLSSFSLFIVPVTYAQEATTTTLVAPPQLNPLSSVDIEKKIKNDFADAPIMLSIARCESGFRQFNSDGSALAGGSGGMIGIFQISALHIQKAISLGFDITTVDGNIGYARYLYTNQSTDPWVSSIGCWNTNTNSSTGTSQSGPLSKNLSFGMIDPEIISLQQILNRSGFPVATDGGPGSPGLETNKFGSLTRAAVRNFQCAKNQICSGNEYTTGYGLVDAQTRLLLLGNSGAPLPTTETGAPQVTPEISETLTTDSPEIKSLKAQIVLLLAQVKELQKQLALLSY